MFSSIRITGQMISVYPVRGYVMVSRIVRITLMSRLIVQKWYAPRHSSSVRIVTARSCGSCVTVMMTVVMGLMRSMISVHNVLPHSSGKLMFEYSGFSFTC